MGRLCFAVPPRYDFCFSFALTYTRCIHHVVKCMYFDSFAAARQTTSRLMGLGYEVTNSETWLSYQTSNCVDRLREPSCLGNVLKIFKHF